MGKTVEQSQMLGHEGSVMGERGGVYSCLILNHLTIISSVFLSEKRWKFNIQFSVSTFFIYYRV